jgi:protein-disulfide isomerase
MSQSNQRSQAILRECDRTWGNIKAKIILIEYADFQCPQSAQAYFIVKTLQERLNDQLCFVFRHFPQPHLHPQAQKAAEAAEAAGTQGKFWEMHDTLFEHQNSLDDGDLVEYADRLNLNVRQFLQELSDFVHRDRIQADLEIACHSNVTKTPTFFICIRHTEIQQLESLLTILQKNFLL